MKDKTSKLTNCRLCVDFSETATKDLYCAAGLEMFTEHVCESFGFKVEELKDLPGAPCYLCGDVEGEFKPECDTAGENLEPGASCPVCSGEELDTGISAPLA